MASVDADLVVFEGHVELSTEVVRRLHVEVCVGLAPRAVSGVVKALQEVADPAGLPLGADELEAGMAVRDATADELHDRVGDRGECECIAGDAGERRAPVLGQAHIEGASAEDVHRDRETDLLGSGPERLI